jgi:DNA replication and repair protein RecF
VAAVIEGPHGRFEVGTGRDGESTVSRRLVRIDGKSRSGPQALAEKVPMLWLTPSQDRLFQDQPGSRRRFLDRLVAVLDPSHGTRIGEYERALRERARLLREKRADPDWLTALERTMAESGIAIAAARCQTAADLTRMAAAGIGPFPAAIVTAAGEAEQWLGECPAVEAEDRLARALAGTRARDGELGGAAHGPHRTDMAVIHASQGLAAQAMSTGEQKTLLLSIVLGAARLQAEKRGFTPVLLLDEVSAHLDKNYRRALYEEVTALGAQAWLTGTDAGLFAALEGAARMFNVADGNVHEVA